MKQTGNVIFALLALVVGLLFLRHDPSLSPAAAGRLSQGLAALLLWATAALGAGQAVVGWFFPQLASDSRGWLHALVAGLLLWGLGGFGLVLMGHLDSPGFVALALMLSVGWLKPAAIPLPAMPGAGTLLAMGIVGLPGLVDAVAPPVDTDELYYQLALPRRMLESGQLFGGWWAPDGSRPMILHLPYAALLWAGGEVAPRMMHLGICLLLLIFVEELAKSWSACAPGTNRPWGLGLGPLLLATSWSFVHEAGLAANNLPVALAVLAAADAALRAQAGPLALAAGLALSIKYTAAGPLFGVFLFGTLPWGRRLAAGMGALLLLCPWWLRNVFEGLHPLFPYAGWEPLNGTQFRFQYLEKYGAGRGPLDLLLAPYRAVLEAEIGSFRFLGKLSPGWLAALPLLMFGRCAPLLRLLGMVAVGLVAWVAGPHWIRHLLPLLPLLALTLSMAALRGLERPAAWVLGLVVLAGLPANLGPIATTLADRLPVALGQEKREDFLNRRVEDWPAISWMNTHLPEEARVAVFFGWSGYYLDRDYILGSVEDHIPTRHLLLREGEHSLQALRELGVRYVLYERVGFLPKVYPFLSSADFQAQFVGAEALLSRLLLKEGSLVFQSGRASVWRIEEAPLP